MHEFGARIDNPDYSRTLQAVGKWTGPRVRNAKIGLKVFPSIIVLLANDLLFAALPGPYQGYHDRALSLLLIPPLLAINELRWKYTRP